MASAAPRIPRISPEALKAILDEMPRIVVVDVRDPADYFSSPQTIAGAIRLPPDQCAEASQIVPRGVRVIVFAAGPPAGTAERCANQLRRDGYDDVSVLDDGWNGWIARDYPTMPREL